MDRLFLKHWLLEHRFSVPAWKGNCCEHHSSDQLHANWLPCHPKFSINASLTKTHTGSTYASLQTDVPIHGYSLVHACVRMQVTGLHGPASGPAVSSPSLPPAPSWISRVSAMFGMALKKKKNTYVVHTWYKCVHFMCTHAYTWTCTHMYIYKNLTHCLTGKVTGRYSWVCSSSRI